MRATHFRDSYALEVECLREKCQLVRGIIQKLRKTEFEENATTREYLEKTYRVLNDQMEKKWSYGEPADKENEMNKREVIQTGTAGTRDSKHDLRRTADGKRAKKTPAEIKEMQERI